MTDGGDSDDTGALLAAIAAGDLDALERLYRALRVAVFSVALAVVWDASLAEDVLHDTFVRVFDKAHTFRSGTNGRAWLLAIARNAAIDAVRRRDRERPLLRADAGAEEEPTGLLGWTGALLSLDPVERQIVVLHALGGLTHAEVAVELGLPPGTVRWKYRVALARLAPFATEARDA